MPKSELSFSLSYEQFSKIQDHHWTNTKIKIYIKFFVYDLNKRWSLEME